MAGTSKPKDSKTSRMPVTAMTPEMYAWIEQRAKETETSRGDVIREAVELLMKQRPKKKESNE